MIKNKMESEGGEIQNFIRVGVISVLASMSVTSGEEREKRSGGSFGSILGRENTSRERRLPVEPVYRKKRRRGGGGRCEKKKIQKVRRGVKSGHWDLG